MVRSETPPPDSPAWSAVRRWRAESNGRLDARSFTLWWPCNPSEEWQGWFETLPFEPLRGHRPSLSIRLIGPVDAFLILFSAASSGGAYGPQHGNAYPRLHAWESFGWLAGAEPDVPCTEVAASADQCRWYTFDNDWFDHVAWDLGLICIHRDCHTLNVLAATDTD